MKFLKEKKNIIISFIIGVILASSITVYATNQYLASQVDYNRNGQAKVSDALDDLYTKTKDYKRLDTITTANANDIISGKTAYDNLGNLITGTAVIGNGLKDTISIPSNYTRRFFQL